MRTRYSIFIPLGVSDNKIVRNSCNFVIYYRPIFTIYLGDLCTDKGITLGDVTKQICDSTQTTCEAYIKKGTVNNVDVQTCNAYCSAFGLECKEMYDDNNDCTKGTKYPTCDDTGGGTSDHICVCGKSM